LQSRYDGSLGTRLSIVLLSGNLKLRFEMQKKPIVLTLTSIPPRFPNLPAKFKAIEKQTNRPDVVELNLPVAYRRFQGEIPSLPSLPEWVKVHVCETDYGPATKVLPTVERWREKDADLLICDDDRIPDPRWIERLLQARSQRPNDIITERGWNINDRFGDLRINLNLPRSVPHPHGGRNTRYRLMRALSLGILHPARKLFIEPGYVDIFEGFLGVLMPSKAIPAEAFEIPEIVWTVDDVWLSGMAYHNGFKVWAHDIARPVFSDGYYDKIASLRAFKKNDHDRKSADRYAVDYLRKVYNVWP